MNWHWKTNLLKKILKTKLRMAVVVGQQQISNVDENGSSGTAKLVWLLMVAALVGVDG
jgi:hypothetical protein